MITASFIFWMGTGFIIGIVGGSFFEWCLHRYLMHRRIPLFSYPFERHALTHHRIFKADETYHLQCEENKNTVPMAWWNGPVLIAVAQIPFATLAFFAGGMALLCGSFLASCLYYGAYEFLHWCMHIPKKRHVERSGIFFRLNGHHLLHHRYMNKNFNVVLPLADFLLRTLMVRSAISFAQAKGPSVPNVQPDFQAEQENLNRQV